MEHVIKKLLKTIIQIGIFCFIYWLGTQFVTITGLPIPGNVVGILMLFGLLSLGVVREEHLREATDFFLKHLLFFFVPITLGLVNCLQVFIDYGLILAAAIIVSSFLSLWTVGYLTQLLQRGKR
jgi:holin-like protein